MRPPFSPPDGPRNPSTSHPHRTPARGPHPLSLRIRQPRLGLRVAGQRHSTHCKAHREYWEWVGKRNEERFTTNTSHGRGYDSKNLMHTLRLLDMAGEIAREGELRIRRPNRDYLLRVRAGEFTYDDLVARAENQLAEVQAAFVASSLPDAPDRHQVNALLIELRESFTA